MSNSSTADPHVLLGTIGADSAQPEQRDPTQQISPGVTTWAPHRLTTAQLADTSAARAADGLVIDHSGTTQRLLGGISGAVPVYVRPDERTGTAQFSNRMSALANDTEVRADWDAWAHVLTAGAPLTGHTVMAGVKRLRPWESVSADGQTVRFERDPWPWLTIESDPAATVDELAEALQNAIADLVTDNRPISLLSGGWDSRILALYAQHVTEQPVRAFTTSSDTGHVLEELVAAQVAHELGAEHTIVTPRVDSFAKDFRSFAHAVDYQTSFHTWLVPILNHFSTHHVDGVVLDGLGGGLMVGGDFTAGRTREDRVSGLLKYLDGAEAVLRPEVARNIAERTRASFEQFDRDWPDVSGHPFEATFTAYLNRTITGIGLSPYGLVANSHPAATPFLDDRVVHAALRIPADQHSGGQLYPQLTEILSPTLAALRTAQPLAPWPRPHPRRITASESIAFLHSTVVNGPAAELLANDVARAGESAWRKLLSRTAPQHLLRSLAVLNLWLSEYADSFTGPGVEELLS